MEQMSSSRDCWWRLWHVGGMESWTGIFLSAQSKSSACGTGKDNPNTSGRMGTPNQESKLVRSFQKWSRFYRCYSWSDRFLVAILPLLQVSKSQQYRQGQADRGQTKSVETHVYQYMSPLLPLKSLWLPSAFQHLPKGLLCPSLTQEGCLFWLFSVLAGRCFSQALLAYWFCHSFIYHRPMGIYFIHWLLISNSLTFFWADCFRLIHWEFPYQAHVLFEKMTLRKVSQTQTIIRNCLRKPGALHK